MTKIERTCSNCQHFTDGACSAPLPLSFVGIHWRRKVKPDGGAECGAHRMKITRKPSAKAEAVQS